MSVVYSGYSLKLPSLKKIKVGDTVYAVTIDKNELCGLCGDIVDLASAGLEERGLGEEVFLKPLYERIKNHTNPGKNLINSLNNNIEIEKLIEEYGKPCDI